MTELLEVRDHVLSNSVLLAPGIASATKYELWMLIAWNNPDLWARLGLGGELYRENNRVFFFPFFLSCFWFDEFKREETFKKADKWSHLSMKYNINNIFVVTN